MLGMFHLLPLLKGWEYKHHILTRTVKRGADPAELAISEKGWLVQISEFTDDAYGTLKLEWQGADLQMLEATWTPQRCYDTGSFEQDPSGFLLRYFRPNPQSTAGLYIVYVFGGGFTGALWPYVPTIRASVYLPVESTQEEATIEAHAVTVAITDTKKFIESLRAVLAILDMKIDPALLTTGPAEFRGEK